MIDGPFPETEQQLAGFWLWHVQSMEEAIDWVKRCPNPMDGSGEIEVRPVAELDDFGETCPRSFEPQPAVARGNLAARPVTARRGRGGLRSV